MESALPISDFYAADNRRKVVKRFEQNEYEGLNT